MSEFHPLILDDAGLLRELPLDVTAVVGPTWITHEYMVPLYSSMVIVGTMLIDDTLFINGTLGVL